MSFWDNQKKFFSNTYLAPLITSSIFVTIVQSISVQYGNSQSDAKRITAQAIAFFITLAIGGIAKAYFFYLIGKSQGVLESQKFGRFLNKVLVEWVIAEIRIQLRTLFYLVIPIIPGVIIIFLIHGSLTSVFYLVPFAIPGLIEALRLSLAPVHVFFNPKMEDEEFDPIHASRDSITLKEKSVLFILFALTVFSLGLQMSVSGGNVFAGGAQLFKALAFIPIAVLSSYVFFIYIIQLYFQFNSDKNDQQT